MPRMLKPALAGLAISSLCLGFAADISAQAPAKKKSAIQPMQAEAPSKSGGESGKLPRPKAESLRMPILDPDLEQILKDWERTTSRFKNMTGEFSRYKYDKTFEVEYRGRGKFAYEAPDKGNYELHGLEPGKDKQGRPEVSKKRGYQVKAASPERWVCNGKEIIKINEKEKTYEKLAIPPESQGENIMDGPLPFLFGMKADKAKLRYDLALLEHKDEAEIWLEVLPKLQKDAANWVKAKVVIEAKTFKPRAVMLVDPTGGESVHVFDTENLEINHKPGFFEGDPFKPNLRNLRLVLNNDKRPPGAAAATPGAPAATKQSKTSGNGGRAASLSDFDRDLGRAADTAGGKKSTTVNRK